MSAAAPPPTHTNVTDMGKFIHTLLLAAALTAGTAASAQENAANGRPAPGQCPDRTQAADSLARRIAAELSLDNATTEKFVTAYTQCQKELWTLRPQRGPQGGPKGRPDGACGKGAPAMKGDTLPPPPPAEGAGCGGDKQCGKQDGAKCCKKADKQCYDSTAAKQCCKASGKKSGVKSGKRMPGHGGRSREAFEIRKKYREEYAKFLTDEQIERVSQLERQMMPRPAGPRMPQGQRPPQQPDEAE